MATRKNTFLLKGSSVPGKKPVAGDLQLKELAINFADVILYASGTTANSIIPIGWDRISRTGDTMSGTLYAPTISATTYQNLPTDIRVTGGTYGAGTATFTNNTGGTFNVTGFSTGGGSTFTGGTVTGPTRFTGGLTANTLVLSAGTVASGSTTISFVSANINNFLEYNVQNSSTLTQAQAGYAATADNGSPTNGFVWMGINNSNFNFQTTYNIGVGNDVSFLGSGQDMYIANANNSKSIIFSTGTAISPFFSEKMRITNVGNLLIGTSTSANDSLLQVSGNTTIIGNLTASTISATTYTNLPTDIRVTGGTYAAGTTTFTNNTGGTFSVTGFSQGGGTFTGGTITGPTIALNGFSANTISATTYQNLPPEIMITGITNNNNLIRITNNTGGTFSTLFNTVTGLTINGSLTVTGGTSGSTLNLSNISSGITGTSSSNLAIDTGGKLITGLPYNSVNATGNITTTSAVDVVVTNMNITGASGTYIIWFTTTVTGTATTARNITISLYANGIVIPNSSMTVIASSNFIDSVSCMAIGTIGASQTIDARWRTSTATSQIGNRILTVLKVT